MSGWRGGRFFTEGDHSYVTVIASNYFETPEKLAVDLTATGGLKLRKVKHAGKRRQYTGGESLDVTVPAGGEVRLDFQTTAVAPGETTLLARARGQRESDAVRETKPIVPWGAKEVVGDGGVLRDGATPGKQTATFAFELPAKIGPGSQSLTVALLPSVAAVAIEALPYLAGYPYGCVEQTMSRFLPTVVMRKTLRDVGVRPEDLRDLISKLGAGRQSRRSRMGRNPVYSAKEVDRMIAKGLARLMDFQREDGGWGWWRDGDGDFYITAYVMYGLATARAAGVEVPDKVYDRGLAQLISLTEGPKPGRSAERESYRMGDDNARAFALRQPGTARHESGLLRQPASQGQANAELQADLRAARRVPRSADHRRGDVLPVGPGQFPRRPTDHHPAAGGAVSPRSSFPLYGGRLARWSDGVWAS